MRLVYLFVLLSGCATSYPQIDYGNAPPRDWPRLTQSVMYGTESEVKAWCSRDPRLASGRKAGCALLYFDLGRCYIYLTSKDPELLKHEQAHCNGYVHVGDGDIAHRAVQDWKRK